MNRQRMLTVLVAAALLGLAAWTYSSGSSAVPGAIGSTVTTTTTPETATTAPPSTIGSPPTEPGPTTSAGPTTTVAANPEAYATALYGYWTQRDRKSAAKVATVAVVNTLFASVWHASGGWVGQGCQGAAGSTFCTWVRPHRKLVIQVRNATGGLPLLVIAATMLKTA